MNRVLHSFIFHLVLLFLIQYMYMPPLGLLKTDKELVQKKV